MRFEYSTDGVSWQLASVDNTPTNIGQDEISWIADFSIEWSAENLQATPSGRGRDYLDYANALTGERMRRIYPGLIHTWDGSGWVSGIKS